MSDISLHITWLDLILASPVLGWPGLIVGAVLGALLWRRRRIVGGLLAAAAGCVMWTFVDILLL
jgi:hypothetical protein